MALLLFEFDSFKENQLYNEKLATKIYIYYVNLSLTTPFINLLKLKCKT